MKVETSNLDDYHSQTIKNTKLVSALCSLIWLVKSNKTESSFDFKLAHRNLIFSFICITDSFFHRCCPTQSWTVISSVTILKHKIPTGINDALLINLWGMSPKWLINECGVLALFMHTLTFYTCFDRQTISPRQSIMIDLSLRGSHFSTSPANQAWFLRWCKSRCSSLTHLKAQGDCPYKTISLCNANALLKTTYVFWPQMTMYLSCVKS